MTVRMDDIGLALGDPGQRFLAIGRFADRESFLLEVVAQHGDDSGLVIDDQDERLQLRSLPRTALIACGGSSTAIERSPFGRA
jgi:hypothetical protein